MKYDTVVIDGDNLAWKSFYAMSNLSFDGKPTGAIFGSLKAILSYYKKYNPDYLVMTWTHSNSYRKDIYPEYKATRKDKDTSYFDQQHILVKLLSAIGIPQAKVKGFEADDIIAEVVNEAKEFPTLIISSDKDLLQLIGETVHVLKGDQLYNSERVYEEYGCWPKDIPLWLSIVGDKSDNIKGVPGIGPKKTKDLFKEISGATLRALIFELDNVPKEKSSTLLKVGEHRNIVDQNLRIIELKSGRIEPSDNIIHKEIDQEKAIKIIESQGMQSLLVPTLELMSKWKSL